MSRIAVNTRLGFAGMGNMRGLGACNTQANFDRENAAFNAGRDLAVATTKTLRELEAKRDQLKAQLAQMTAPK